MKLFVNVNWSGEKWNEKSKKITINNRLAISGNNNRQNVREEKSDWLPKNCLLAIHCIPILTLFDDFIFVCSAYKRFVIPMWYIYDDKKITKQKSDSMFCRLYLCMIFLFFEEKWHKYFNIYMYETKERGARTISQSSNLSTNQCIYIHSMWDYIYSLMIMRSILWWLLINLIIYSYYL